MWPWKSKAADRDQDAAKQAEFNEILKTARQIAERRPEALRSLVRLIGRQQQARCMASIVKKGAFQEAAADLLVDSLWFSSTQSLDDNGTTLGQLMRRAEYRRPLELGADVLLPVPWNREQLIRSMCTLCHDAGGKEWRQDRNHKVKYWLPWGVGLIEGGNHSLTVGTVNGCGKIVRYEAYDGSRVFEFVECDGSHFKRKCDGRVVSPVRDVEFAAIFEIGRLMTQCGVTA